MFTEPAVIASPWLYQTALLISLQAATESTTAGVWDAVTPSD